MQVLKTFNNMASPFVPWVFANFLDLFLKLFSMALWARLLIYQVTPFSSHYFYHWVCKMTNFVVRPLKIVARQIVGHKSETVSLIILIILLQAFRLWQPWFPSQHYLSTWRFLVAIASHLGNQLCNIYFYIILLYALLSWIRPWPQTTWATWLFLLSEPLLSFLRRFIPPIRGIDMSALLILLILQCLSNYLFLPLIHYAQTPVIASDLAFNLYSLSSD